MKWIGSNGGPFIVLPWAQRAKWEGADAPAAGRVVRAKFRWDGEANPATDYDEACDRACGPAFFGLVRRKDFVALALTMYSKTWVPQPRGGIIVHCDTTPSEAHANRIVRGLGTAQVRWRKTRLRMPGGKLVMCDAAYPGRSQPPKMRLVFQLPAGTYAISVADHEPDVETAMTLYRFTRG